MQRRTNIQVSSLIILLGILTILVQFTVYYFFGAYLIIWGISSLVSVICCHILLEQTSSYEACFSYSLFSLFVSLIVTVISYFGKVQTFLPYTAALLGIVVINWLIPMIHCYLRYMLDYGTKVEDFSSFYRNLSLVFVMFYITALIYGSFVKDAYPWAFPMNNSSYNLIPFSIIATQIEDYLYDYIPLSDIIIYLATRIIAYIPYGFYITLLLRRQSKLTRFFALLQLPLIIEILQYFFIPRYCDIDDLIYGLIGGLLGSLMFLLTAVIFQAISGKEFLSRENEYRHSGSSLYF